MGGRGAAKLQTLSRCFLNSANLKDSTAANCVNNIMFDLPGVLCSWSFALFAVLLEIALREVPVIEKAWIMDAIRLIMYFSKCKRRIWAFRPVKTKSAQHTRALYGKVWNMKCSKSKYFSWGEGHLYNLYSSQFLC